MSSPPSVSSIPNLEFTKISSFVSLYTPPALQPPNKPSSTDPTTILCCTWIGASPRSRALNNAYHKYHNLYPSARIILVRSNPDWFLSTPNAARRKQTAPVLDTIAADPSGDKQRLLVHFFSNGGSVAFYDICTMYKARFGKKLAVKALVIDSAPGNPTAMEGWAGMKPGLPKGMFWYPAAVAIWLVIAIVWVQTRVFGIDSIVDHARKGGLDFKIMDKSAKRLYCYSLADNVVGYKGIDREVEKARVAGVDVSVVREEKTPHVQHMIMEPERYWRSIEQLWESTRM